MTFDEAEAFLRSGDWLWLWQGEESQRPPMGVLEAIKNQALLEMHHTELLLWEAK